MGLFPIVKKKWNSRKRLAAIGALHWFAGTTLFMSQPDWHFYVTVTVGLVL